MARGNEPLLSQRDSLEQSEDRGYLEEESLYESKSFASSPRKRWRETAVFVWALFATVMIVILGVSYERKLGHSTDRSKPSGKRNLIFMVSDGMGPTSLALTRPTWQQLYEMPYNEDLTLDKHLIGQSRTRSNSSLVTDSAAGATAFSCAQKSYNGAISVLPDGTPCGTVLEAAKLAGYKTGLVVTTRLTDATPAVFASHVHNRSEEDRIAQQLLGDQPLGQMVDLFLGAGRCHFTPQAAEGSCRSDDVDLVEKAKQNGYHYISDRKGFDGLNAGKNVQLPLLGLFADLDIPYEIDRRNENDTYPSLAEMARTAMTALSDATKDSDKGFFLMVEGSKIDHAGHANDPSTQVHEVLSYDAAMASVVRFLEEDDTEGVMISTSDHETGGLADARQINDDYPEYLWYPGVLLNASASSERLADDYSQYRLSKPPGADMTQYLYNLVATGLGITDASDDEILRLAGELDTAAYVLADMVSRRAQIGWSTHGHSGADVNIYAWPRDAAAPLAGVHENTEVGAFLKNYLDVDVDAVTRKLRKSKELKTADGKSWLGDLPEEGQRLDGQDHRQHYAGIHKR